MYCETCGKKAATVHMTIVSWPSGEIVRHLCEFCYPEAEAARARIDTVPPTVQLPAAVELITATEYLGISVKAAANGADKPVFKHLCRELERLPVTRARLAVELLEMAWKSLEEEGDPYDLIGLGCSFGNSVQAPKSQEYVDLLE